MTQNLLTLPLRIGFGAARTAFDISYKTIDVSIKLAGTAIGTIRPGAGQTTGATETATPPPAEPPARTPQPRKPRTTSPQTSRVNGQSGQNGQSVPPPIPTAPPPPLTPPSEQPDTPLTSQEAATKTLDDEDEVVAELAEPGAEDGAGAQLDVAEPWEGYAELNAEEAIDRISAASAAELAVVELYEQTHKKRRTVLDAAAKRLQALSPPEAG